MTAVRLRTPLRQAPNCPVRSQVASTGAPSPGAGRRPRRPHNFIDETGRTYGRLTVIARHPFSRGHSGAYWRCRCACGNEHIAPARYLRSGEVQSCGCLQRETRRRNLLDNSRRYPAPVPPIHPAKLHDARERLIESVADQLSHALWGQSYARLERLLQREIKPTLYSLLRGRDAKLSTLSDVCEAAGYTITVNIEPKKEMHA